jgi:glutamine amidotransferase
MADSWVTVPTNSVLTIHDQTVLIHPILDEFYSADPLNSRSLTFAQAKGQTVTNTKKEGLNISRINSQLASVDMDSSSDKGSQDATTP